MRFLTLTRAILLGLAATSPLMAQQPGTTLNTRRSLPNTAIYSRLPRIFEANQGQTNAEADFVSRGNGYTAFLTREGMVLSLHGALIAQEPSAVPRQSTDATLKFRLLGANKKSVAVGEDPQIGRVNYFIGNDPAQWHTKIPTFAKIRYKNIYPGIDLIFYGNHRQLEYDFAVSPGADPRSIQLEIQGASQIALDGQGDLVLQTTAGQLRFQCPIVYQESKGQRIPVYGGYAIKDSTHISFQVNQYDSTKRLVIDPVLVYSTYLGGSGVDQPTGLALDSSGSIYVSGYTNSTDFPLATWGGLASNSYHIFVAKLDATGSNLLYADYIGGNSQDYGLGLVVDQANEVYVTGSTASSNFPAVHAYQAQQPGPYSGFLTKVSADGSTLLYSTYLGGNTFDQVTGIAIDNLSHVYVTGYTGSNNFPTASAYQSTISPNGGGLYGDYGFLTKFSPDGSSLVYSTYLAGNSNVVENCGSPCWPSPYSAINAIAVDGSGNAYVTGTTNTYNFPTTSGVYLTTNTTQQDASIGFVSKFSAAGALQYSTYFYGTSSDPVTINGIAVDTSGSAYITGVAFSNGSFPVTSTGICDPSVYGFSCSYGFISKFDSGASTLLYSTFLGPNNFASPRTIVLDANDDAYVAASTSSAAFNTVNGIENYSHGMDIIVVEIDPSASSELFATFLGASGDEQPAGLALDSHGNIYIAGSTNSTDLPTTSGAFQTLPGGNTDAFVAKIGPAAAASVSLSPDMLQYGSVAVGSTSQAANVLLRNMGSSPLSISSISASGDFSESDDCGTIVSAAGSCSLSVKFTPTATGTRSGLVTIQDDASGSPHSVDLSGTGVGAAVSMMPASLTFAAQQVGTSSTAQAITLTNNGNEVLSISGIQATEDFAQTNNCGSSLSVSSSCTVNVTFTPTAAGTRNGNLIVNDNAQGTPQTATLAGTGSAPVVALAPSSLTFSSQPLTTTSAAQSVTLTNTGNATLSIGSIQATGDFSQVNNCLSSLSPSSSCTINVTFTPTASGTRSGTVTVSDNAQGSPQVVALSGVGSASPAPVAALSPSNVTFASQPLTTSSAAQSVTLTNTGNATLTIASIQATGDYAETDNCKSQLRAGSICTISVSFTPKASGTRTGMLIVTDNASGSPQSVALAGAGSDFSLTVSPSSNSVSAGGTAIYTLSLSSVGGAFSSAVNLTCAGLPAQSTCTFTPSAVAPGASGGSSKLSISVGGTTAKAVPALRQHNGSFYAAWMNLQGFGLLGMFLAGPRKRSKRWAVLLLLVVLLLGLSFMVGCAGGTGIQSQTQPTTYTVTVTGTSGSLQHSLPLTLTVQ